MITLYTWTDYTRGYFKEIAVDENNKVVWHEENPDEEIDRLKMTVQQVWNQEITRHPSDLALYWDAREFSSLEHFKSYKL